MLLDNFMESMAASMESNSNASTSTNNNSHNSNSHKGGSTMSTNTSNSNSKAHNSNSNSRKPRKANSKASAPKANSNASNSNAPTLPDTLPAVANAGISGKGMEQDAATSLLFQYHIRKALEIYGGAASICQVYNFLRGDSPLRLEKDGSPKQDNLPRWRGLGSSKLFRANTEGTLLTYTHKVCSNGRVRSVAVAGPTLQEFPSK